MGVFVIDLQADNVSSRAVIRKGSIYCIDSLSQQGHLFRFYDENGHPLTAGDGLRVWVRDKLVELDADN
jgi:hypothetical protein